ncbi:hypothetical protein [Nocardioides speluncae]|uniref:hypothetical protein n=1 Tax=Nocardioides speluncae TaxID=2670337 RepID=UPI001F0B8086|nr:hypothetical protein [Nocardioides speluncae]
MMSARRRSGRSALSVSVGSRWASATPRPSMMSPTTVSVISGSGSASGGDAVRLGGPDGLGADDLGSDGAGSTLSGVLQAVIASTAATTAPRRTTRTASMPPR